MSFQLSKNKRLRKLAVGLLKTFNPGAISIKHPFTGGKLKLDAYTHKGYWYRGKLVEKDSMDMFSVLINKGDTVIEVGAHIGYMAQFYSYIVGESGSVYVFEPAEDNLRFLRKNIDTAPFKNIVLIEKAVSETTGTATFYVETVTGQNNSLVPDHAGPNSHKNISDESKKSVIEVPTISLDDFIHEKNLHKINFIKIDIEAAELFAIKGMIQLLQNFKPRFMIEVSRNYEEIHSILHGLGYRFFDIERKELQKLSYGNIFGIHVNDHAGLDAINNNDA